jgi:mannose-6-phosphate isomerase-like protein (cupin superfamily)
MKIKSAVVLLASSAMMLCAQNPTDLFTPAKLKQLTQKLAAESKKNHGEFSGETLTRYGNHLTMIAHREKTGSSEVHEKVADFLYIIDGDTTVITGGKVVNGKTTEPNEIRGASIQGGHSQKMGVGDIIHIQANIPHQMILAPGHTVTYFVIKVNE